MSKRTIGADGLDEPIRPRYAFESERMQISREWHNVTGTDIPDRIEMLPIAEQRAALEFQWRKYQPVTETRGNDDSLLDSDKVMEAEREALRQQQEELRKQAKAKEQRERESAEKARADALKPEIEQATIFCDAVIEFAGKWFEANGEKMWQDRANVELVAAKNCILFQIGEMVR